MFPTILAVLKRSGVEFDLGPQHAKDAVLKRIVPKVGSSDEVSVSRREAGPKIPCTSNCPKPFPYAIVGVMIASSAPLS